MCKNRADPELHEDLILHLMHAIEIAIGSIVMPAQVQHSMQRVQKQLAGDRAALQLCAPTRFGRADHHLAGKCAASGIQVHGKREHVGWSKELEVPSMQVGHRAVVNQRDRELLQRRTQQGVGLPQMFLEERQISSIRLSRHREDKSRHAVFAESVEAVGEEMPAVDGYASLP
jgi:hypothetical protein